VKLDVKLPGREHPGSGSTVEETRIERWRRVAVLTGARGKIRLFVIEPSEDTKKAQNLRAAVSLWVAFYNFVRVHETLRMTPSMAAGLTDHVWSMAELLSVALAMGGDARTAPAGGGDAPNGPVGGCGPALPPPPTPKALPPGRPVASAPWLRVIDGGLDEAA
jgi:hypothetical protein